jgi:tetratricopeptide (TPR) repeat protein
MARLLVAGDDSTLARYGRSVGWVVVSDASKKLKRQARCLYAKGREAEASRVDAFNKRIAAVLASEYEYGLYLDHLLFLESLPSHTRRALITEQSKYYAFVSQIHRSPAEKLERYTEFLGIFRRYNDLMYIAAVEYELSYVWKTLGDESRQIEFLRAAARDFAGCGLHEMSSTAFVELGDYHEAAGEIDSMVFYYEEARKIAHRSRLPWHAGLVESRYASHYEKRGRLSLAHELMTRAIDVCREYRGEYSELYHIVEAMTFDARLGCWAVVDRLLTRARVLQTRCGDDPYEYGELYSLQVDLMEGRLRMTRGDARAAETCFRRAEKAIRGLHMPYTNEPETARLYLFWAEGLLENGRPDEALDIARRGVRLSRKADMPVLAARSELLIAKTEFLVGDLESCRRALSRFDSLAAVEKGALEGEGVERCALLGQIELASGDRQAAEDALEAGLAAMRTFVSNADASVQSYLWIGECNELRQLMHDLTARDPVLGYGAELFWQEFCSLLGCKETRKREAESPSVSAERGEAPGGEGRPSAMAHFEERARDAKARVAALGAVHSVYVERGDEIWRWTVSADSIRRETLGSPTEEVRGKVAGIWNAVAFDGPGPGSLSSRVLSEGLRTLALSLLPPEVAQGVSPSAEGPFLITTDGFLSSVPFEAFDVGSEGEYIPLLMRRDVAYLRYATDVDGTPSTKPGVILVNAVTSNEAASGRFPRPDLAEAVIEGETLAALEPGSRLLTGEDATKANLRSLWTDAPFVYIAAHMLRDPQVPYLMLVPLAVPDGPAAPDAGYLDFDDARAAELSRCRIVVLSGCSSGAPYVDIENAAPSLGDAFIDAGAHAVVQTYWDVRDEDARALMARFVPLWRDPGVSGVHALCEARRTVFRETGGMVAFGRWASFYIEIRGF